MLLNQSEEKFILDLKKEGYIVSVIDFEKFIKAFKEEIVKEIKKSIEDDTFSKKMFEIFGHYSTYVPLFCLADIRHINQVEDAYFYEKMKTNFKGFFKEENIKVGKATKVNALKLKLLKELETKLERKVFRVFLSYLKENNFLSFISYSYNWLGYSNFDLNSKSYINASLALQENLYNLTGTEQILVEDKFIEILNKFLEDFKEEQYIGNKRNRFSYKYWSPHKDKNVEGMEAMLKQF